MTGRTWFLVLLVAGSLAAVGWAVRGSRLPPADFTWCNESEIESVDPAIITGSPEGRICWSLFEGLTRPRAEDNHGEPGVAERWDISPDGRVYTFYLRNDARWSSGDAVTSGDFVYSFRRLLDPMIGAEYAYLAWYIKNAKRYSLGAKGIGPGDPVEVELNPPAGAVNTVRGKVLRGELVRVEGSDADAQSRRNRVFIVSIENREHRFRLADDRDRLPAGIKPSRQVLLDFSEVGIRAIDERTLEIRLDNPTHYFLDLLAFYPLAPVNQKCLEKYGKPAWTKPANIITNGAFRLQEHRIRDRIRLVKSDTYWDRDHVKISVADALATDDRITALNLYLTGSVDWVTQPPPNAIRELLKSNPPRNDLNPAPQLTIYHYLLNVNRPPLNDVRVRRALSLALDREEICKIGTAAGEAPALSMVPPGIEGYTSPQCPPRNPQLARQLLAEAGYPKGLGFPKLEIHYNTDVVHQAIAELVRKQWQRELGITVTLRNEEWSSMQATQHTMDFMISRRAWVGDYIDPNTFLDLFVSGGANNCTGFANPQYDRLIADAAREPDAVKRLKMLHDAEQILMNEMPIIPIFYYVSRNLVSPKVRGFYNNLRDDHPIRALWIDPSVDQGDPHPNEYMGKKP
jgi:oligopeptide transport system substrate-binding protein